MTKNNKGEVLSNHTSKTRDGVTKLIHNRKIVGAAREDLHACLALMESTEDLPFDWDMTMYNVHYNNRGDAPRVPLQAQERPLDMGDASPESNLDDDYNHDEDNDPAIRTLAFDDALPTSQDDEGVPDAEGYVPKTFLINAVYLVRQDGIEWALAKYTSSLHTYKTTKKRTCVRTIQHYSG